MIQRYFFKHELSDASGITGEQCLRISEAACLSVNGGVDCCGATQHCRAKRRWNARHAEGNDSTGVRHRHTGVIEEGSNILTHELCVVHVGEILRDSHADALCCSVTLHALRLHVKRGLVSVDILLQLLHGEIGHTDEAAGDVCGNRLDGGQHRVVVSLLRPLLVLGIVSILLLDPLEILDHFGKTGAVVAHVLQSGTGGLLTDEGCILCHAHVGNTGCFDLVLSGRLHVHLEEVLHLVIPGVHIGADLVVVLDRLCFIAVGSQLSQLHLGFGLLLRTAPIHVLPTAVLRVIWLSRGASVVRSGGGVSFPRRFFSLNLLLGLGDLLILFLEVNLAQALLLRSGRCVRGDSLSQLLVGQQIRVRLNTYPTAYRVLRILTGCCAPYLFVRQTLLLQRLYGFVFLFLCLSLLAAQGINDRATGLTEESVLCAIVFIVLADGLYVLIVLADRRCVVFLFFLLFRGNRRSRSIFGIVV